jgi:hypothetical protein
LTLADEEQKNKSGKEQNDFINQRLTWLGTFEGLLFTADRFTTNQPSLPVLLPLVGLAFAISVGVGTFAANRALTQLERQAFQKDSWFLKHESLKNVLVLFMPGTAIPVIIAVAWLVLLVERVCHR